jgi:hypothetical protein
MVEVPTYDRLSLVGGHFIGAQNGSGIQIPKK